MSGEQDIDHWVPSAFKDHNQLRCRSWGVHLEKGNGTLVGLYALRIRLESDADIDGHDGTFSSEHSHFAAVHLSHIGVQRKMQGVGIGELMIIHAIEEFAAVADRTGICAMTLVAINRDKANWYEKLGFRRYGADCDRPKMFLPAKSALEMTSAP